MLDHPTTRTPLGSAAQATSATPDAALPAAARALLARVVRGTIGRLEPVLANTLDQLEKSLFAQADTGSCELQQAAFDAMRQVRRYRADLLQKRVEVAASVEATAEGTPKAAPATAWSLLDNGVVEETALIDALAARVETRLHLPLHLLGHRMGALLQRDAIETRLLPIGPHVLLSSLCEASACLDLATVARHALLRQFDRCLAPVLADLYAGANACLADAGILPALCGYQSAARASVASDASVRNPSAAACEQSARPESKREAPSSSEPPGRRFAGNPQTPQVKTRVAPAADPAAMRWQRTSAADDELFGVMRELLGNRRALLGRFSASVSAAPVGAPHPVSPTQLNATLRDLQRGAPPRTDAAHAGRPDAARHGLKSRLLSELQKSAPPQHRAELPQVQGDTVDLLDMLFDHLLKDVPNRSVAAPLLARLQVPLLRVALEDTGFFTRSQHPARRMLDALADAGLYWHDDSDTDEEFSATLRALVERVASEFDGDLAVFEAASEHLQQQLAARMRKAAIAERRHVEAERGRERLARARIAAADAVRATIGTRTLPRFVHSLLTRAWTDVLALSALRGGDGDCQFARQMEVATWLVEHGGCERATSAGQGGDAPADRQLQQELSAGLCQIGYHLDDAETIARTAFGLSENVEQAMVDTVQMHEDTSPNDTPGDTSEPPASRPSVRVVTARTDAGSSVASATAEHTLAAHQRLGENCATGSSNPAEQTQSDAAESEPDVNLRQRLDQLRRLPFGTWFDLAGGDGRRQRCRMSWFSPVTGRCLFVNHRGQRIGDHTLAWLAEEMEQGRARIVREAQTSVVDSAWQAILGMLRSFAPKTADLAVA